MKLSLYCNIKEKKIQGKKYFSKNRGKEFFSMNIHLKENFLFRDYRNIKKRKEKKRKIKKQVIHLEDKHLGFEMWTQKLRLNPRIKKYHFHIVWRIFIRKSEPSWSHFSSTRVTCGYFYFFSSFSPFFFFFLS